MSYTIKNYRSIEVQDSMFVFNYGKKPNGRGGWAFHLGDAAAPVWFHGLYSECKVAAQKAAVVAGVWFIKVAT